MYEFREFEVKDRVRLSDAPGIVTAKHNQYDYTVRLDSGDYRESHWSDMTADTATS